MKYPNGTSTPPKVSSHYGPRPNVGVSNFHHGTDYIGFKHIHAIADGIVTYSGYMNSAAGNTIRVSHGSGVVASRYMHNARNLVREGQFVQEGEVIAVMGDTGNATGKCCHLEISINGMVTNPHEYLRHAVSGSPTSAPTNTPNNSKEVPNMILQIQGKAGIRSGGLYLFADGRREFLGPHAGKGFPLITDEAQITKLFRLYSD